MRAVSIVIVIFMCGLPAPPPAPALETIVRDVAGSGGTVAAGSGFRLAHTVGQPVIAVSTSTEHVHEAGFWYMPWHFVTGVEEEDETCPAAYRLDQNFPNPFNPVTTIRCALPEPSRVSIKIYDVLGREVKIVVDGRMEAGIHRLAVNASGLSSGIYFYRMKTAGFVRTRKMVILR